MRQLGSKYDGKTYLTCSQTDLLYMHLHPFASVLVVLSHVGCLWITGVKQGLSNNFIQTNAIKNRDNCDEAFSAVT